MRILWGGQRGTERLAGVACAAALLVLASGCAAEPAPAPSSSAPTATTPPVFASDEEALAAATEAYANYQATYDAFWAGRKSKAEFLELTTGAALENEEASLEQFESQGWKPVGTSSVDSVSIQSISQTDSGVWQIRTYLCVDISKGDVLDAQGVSVAKPDRPLRLPLEVAFVTPSSTSTELRISESRVWSGKNYC